MVGMDKDYMKRIFFAAMHDDETKGKLEGKRIATFFSEPSTRTRLSFTLAAEHCGAKVYDVGENSAMLKGESEQDTIGVLDSLGFDGVILRSSSNYLLDEMRLKYSRMTFLDAGQGSSTHPTQAFGDLLSMALYGELDLATARVVVLGDISHSRVCASLREALWSYGNRVRTAVVDTVYEADVLYCLRPQVERGYDLDAYDLVQLYGVTEELLEKTGAYLMHPGPYVGVEFGRHLLNHPKSLVKRQVETGLAVRKAYLVEEFSGN